MADKDEKFFITTLKDSKEISQVLANDTCRLILDTISNEPLSTSQISEKLNIPLSTVDDNIKKLAKVGLVDVHHKQWSPKGRKVNYYEPREKFIVLAPRFDQEKVLHALKMVLPIFLFVALVGAGIYWGFNGGSSDKVLTVNESNFILPVPSEEKAPVNAIETPNNLNKFSSYAELKEFVGKTIKGSTRRYYGSGRTVVTVDEGSTATVGGSNVAGSVSSSQPSGYSKTNVQVEGVDEADIVKTDGKYIYTISSNKLVIVSAYPPQDAEILSKTAITGTALEIFVNGDKLVVFEQHQSTGSSPVETQRADGDIGIKYMDYSTPVTSVLVFDISNKKAPHLIGNLSVSGDYFDSRMIGDYVYVVAQQPIYNYYDGEVPLPVVSYGRNTRAIEANEIYYFGAPDSSYSFSTIVSIDLKSGKAADKAFLTGRSQNMYVSENNIYMAHSKWLGWDYYNSAIKEGSSATTEKAIVHKISIDAGNIEYSSSGEVPGNILNQFSMDEYNGYFRIATTSTPLLRTRRDSQNNVYALDVKMNIAGKLEGLAEGERLYSVRFMGDRVYLVTFRQVDPLFVIDLKDPKAPKVLGYLKIPGFSDYMHPYDENHIIGIGKDATDEGSVKGMKISFFDVSDVQNPKEVSKYTIGGRGTDSEVLRDHKAFLFSKTKNLLVFPASISEEWKRLWEGALVFNIDAENGFSYKGAISHRPDSEEPLGYNYDSSLSVRRSLYIDDTLYTVSDKLIKANKLGDLTEVKKLNLYSVNDSIYQ